MQIRKFDKSFLKAGFDCGDEVLNGFIKQQANQIIRRNETVIHCAVKDQTVIGFYTLSSCEIRRSVDDVLLKKQSPYTPIPCALIGRLAVDKNYKGQGIGADLLLHALQTVVNLSKHIGMAFVVVDAKNEQAKAFYERYGFSVLSQQPMRLCYPVKDIPRL